MDSGALIHMKCKKFKEIRNGRNIHLGDDHAHHIMGYGDILVTLPNDSFRRIHNVMYVPRIKINLVFMSTIIDQNQKVEFFKTHYIVKDLLDHCKLVSLGIGVGGLYKLDVTKRSHQALASTVVSTKVFWH